MVLFILRGVFILLAASVTVLYVIAFQEDQGVDFYPILLMIGLTLAAAGAIVCSDVYYNKKKLSSVSGVFLGLVAGLVAAYALSFVVDLIGRLMAPMDPTRQIAFYNLLEGAKVIIGLMTCYIGISMVLQTKDDFRFVIPYVEFTKQIRGQRPILLDTSVIIDGRVLDIVETRVLQGLMVVPKFVLHELQQVADSTDKLRRARGRRGLDVLNKLQHHDAVDLSIEDADAEGPTVDQKLISLAQRIQARVMTNDFNLNKIAAVRGVEVINLNDLAKAMQPTVLPGESLVVNIIKPGESSTQGVGYMDDGTMVVVESARHLIGQQVDAVVTSMLQTSAGRMVFCRTASGGAEHPEVSEAHKKRQTKPVVKPEAVKQVKKSNKNSGNRPASADTIPL